MKLYRLRPEPGIDLNADDPGFIDELSQWYREPGSTFLRANIVSTPQGELSGPDGRSASLSNPIDRVILTELRRQADAVVVGAATVRVEPVPVPAHAPLVILSASGDLSGHQIPPRSLRPGGIIVVTGPSPDTNPLEAFAEHTAQHHTVGDTARVAPQDVRDHLWRHGFRHILLEGGRDTLEAFLRAGMVDELALTLTGPPQISPQPPLPWWKGEWGVWEAILVANDSARNLYFRFRRAE